LIVEDAVGMGLMKNENCLSHCCREMCGGDTAGGNKHPPRGASDICCASAVPGHSCLWPSACSFNPAQADWRTRKHVGGGGGGGGGVPLFCEKLGRRAAWEEVSSRDAAPGNATALPWRILARRGLGNGDRPPRTRPCRLLSKLEGRLEHGGGGGGDNPLWRKLKGVCHWRGKKRGSAFFKMNFARHPT